MVGGQDSGTLASGKPASGSWGDCDLPESDSEDPTLILSSRDLCSVLCSHRTRTAACAESVGGCEAMCSSAPLLSPPLPPPLLPAPLPSVVLTSASPRPFVSPKARVLCWKASGNLAWMEGWMVRQTGIVGSGPEVSGHTGWSCKQASVARLRPSPLCWSLSGAWAHP